MAVDFEKEYRGFFGAVCAHPDLFYTTYPLAKRKGGYRMISIPEHRLMEAQYRISINLRRRFVPHVCAHGFVRRHDIGTNAMVHANCRYLLKMDLKDFFPTITMPCVQALLLRAGYSERTATFLAALCTTFDQDGCRCLPQGAPTSPILSNMAAHGLDKRLYGLAKKHELRYTRYADDLTFSSRGDSETVITPSFIRAVSLIIENEGFAVNAKKTQLIDPKCQKKIVTGINVASQTLSVPRSYKRALRAQIHNTLAGLPQTPISQEVYNQLIGKLAFVRWVEPANPWVAAATLTLNQLFYDS